MRANFPDYSGGTMPDLHRLPFYALAGTQDHYFYKLAQSCFWDSNAQVRAIACKILITGGIVKKESSSSPDI